MDVTKFNEKFNKLNNNIYTVEEIVEPKDGIYEADLIHDNVELSTINIYTESKLAGIKINTYITSTPSLTPWRTAIKIFSAEPTLYITYETTGDTVKHITSTERTNWNDANSKKHTHDNKSVLDGITSTLITAWNSAVTHISDTVKHITSAERTLWNTVSDKLDKTGGTVTGRIICNGGTTVKSLNGGAGTAGHMYIARITVTRTNQDQPITFDIQQRGRNGSVTIQFANSSSTDPALSKFVKRGNVESYIAKVSAGVWDLYILKSEGYDVIDVINMGKGEYMTYLNIDWKGTTVTDLPTGYVKATREYIDMSVAQSALDTDGNQINTTYVKKGTTWNELEGI